MDLVFLKSRDSIHKHYDTKHPLQLRVIKDNGPDKNSLIEYWKDPCTCKFEIQSKLT